MIRALVLLAMMGAILIGSPAWSQQNSNSASVSHPTKNPDQKICEEEIPLGTRLSVHRVCATQSEWQRRRLEDRQAIEKQQSQFPMCGSKEGC